MKKQFVFPAISLLFVIFVISKSSAQNFTFQLVNGNTGFGTPGGNDIVVAGNLVNTGTVPLEIDIIRKENNLPAFWESYICTDICLPPFADSTRLYLPAGQSQAFTLSFITNNTLDTANSLIVFKNVTNNSNKFTQRFYAITTLTTGIKPPLGEEEIKLEVFPNPVSQRVFIRSEQEIQKVECLDASGKKMFVSNEKKTYFSLNVASFPKGFYLLKIYAPDGSFIYKRFIKE